MKARVKATGEIGIVANIDLLFDNKGYRYQSDEVEIIDSYADIDTAKDPDYWTRLEHTYAGMAMQGLLCNRILAGELVKDNNNGIKDMSVVITRAAVVYVTALVEKLKEKEERK